MRFSISALGAAARHFPRPHLIISTVLAGALLITALAPGSGESRTEPPQPLLLPLPPQAASATQPVDDKSHHEQLLDSLDREPAVAQAQVEKMPDWIQLTVQSGDTLSGLLQARGVTASQIHHLLNGDPRLKALATIRPGDRLQLALDDDGKLRTLRYHPTRIDTVEATLSDGRWQVQSHTREYQRQLRLAEATINNSLFLAGQQAGISDNMTMQLANIFGWDVDFVQDIRQGDHFRVLYEELYLDGKKVDDGNILAAEFWNQDRHLTAYRFRHQDGGSEYLDADGRSLRKEFIRTPVAFTRISSRFSMGRKHPILNRVRKHEGIDYAAPSGTPIKAAGKGRVIFAGVKGGYGNVIILKHGQKYSTLYAHMRRFAKGVRVGTRVDQGQTIGYVGMTGLATGPHLHYEFRVNGVHKNPLTVPLPQAQGVSDSERPRFLAEARQLRTQVATLADTATLASNREL